MNFVALLKQCHYQSSTFRRAFCETSIIKTTEPAKLKKKKTSPATMKSHKIRMNKFFEVNQRLASIRKDIPEKYLLTKRLTPPENLYLIDNEVAEKVAKHIVPEIEKNPEQTVCETNAGLGLITSVLLKNHVELVRMYESCSDFKEYLKDKFKNYTGRFELFTKDIFLLSRYEYIDRQDNGNRVEQLLAGVRRKKWTDDPTMTIIGPLPNRPLFRFFLRSLALQSLPTAIGRIQFFVFMSPKDYLILTAGPHLDLHTYQKTSVLFQLFFDFELLEKFPREVFVPWQTPKAYQASRYAGQFEADLMYFVKICFKKDLPVSQDNLLTLYAFIDFFGRGGTRIIPILEKWVPGCGLDLMVPKLRHEDYFQDLNIFTKFGELTPNQIFAIYREVTTHPKYEKGHFMNLIESHLIKSETIESNLDLHLSEKSVETEPLTR